MVERVIVQYYHTARTAHVERLEQSSDQRMYLLYTKSRADFVVDGSADPYVRRTHAFGVVWFCMRQKVDVLEVAEPYAIKLWPQLILVSLLVRLLRLLWLSKARIVTYAIENYPPARKLSEFSHLPHALSKIVCALVGGVLILALDRIVFGTREAKQVYEAQVPRIVRKIVLDAPLVWHLPAPDEVFTEHRRSGVVFLGTFERRKGIFELMAAWPLLQDMGSQEDAFLTLLGKSGEVDKVRSFAAAHPDSVRLVEDPPRAEIFDALRRSQVLVLMSQPARGWKEQVGLPIVEGLAAGCEIVSSNETGIAAWLRHHGHEVVPFDASPGLLASAVKSALAKDRDVTVDLPIIDGRIAAGALMFGPSDG